MTFDFIKNKESQYLITTSIARKEEYYRDLYNIEWGWTGRIDVMFANQFFQEAVQLIINAISLFEKGYFDCAFYSLRQSLEISTTTIYFVDDKEANRNNEMDKWKKEEKFPLHNQMINQLGHRKRDFADVKEKMQDFFDEIDQVKNQMNKYVHKQGLNKFYTYHGSDSSKNKIKRESDFESFLIKSIGAIAIYRLTVDPLPLMLLEDDIYNRTGQLMTESFTSEFIQKYIGQRNIELYKQTNLYQGYYNDIIKNEEIIPPVLSLVKDDFIDRTACEEILTQKHLLNKNDIVAITMTMLLQNLTKIYCIGGFHWYFTSTESVRKNQSYNSEDFDKFKNNTPIYNSNYYEVFLSAIKIGDEEYYLEHNVELTYDEIEILDLIIKI